MFLKSIRLKFIAWYAAILAVTFLLFSMILYYNFSRNLYARLDDLLQTKVEGIFNSIDTYWETQKLEAIKSGAGESVFSRINDINFAKIAERLVNEKLHDPELINMVVQILGADGKIIVSSTNVVSIPDISSEKLKYIVDEDGLFENFAVKLAGAKSLQFRLLTAPVIENDKVAYVVQVASPLNSINTALRRLKFLLFLLLPITVLVTSIVAGEFLASVTLRPINSIIKTARQITAENMKLRIDAPNSKDEIRRLADTFNNMLDKIERSFAAQRHFMQDISHELRTPLTILKGELEVALKRDRSQDEYSSILRSNLEEINNINRIVENLLMLLRFDAGEAALKKEPVDIAALLESVVNDLRTMAVQKGLAINFSYDGSEKIILEADREKLRRAFLNIIDNAVKYTPQKGVISVTLDRERDFVRVVLKDTGIGIAKEDLPFIFDRFYRADKSRTDSSFGLGLSIVKSIVESHRGSVEAESVPKEGTVFTVRLPMAKD